MICDDGVVEKCLPYLGILSRRHNAELYPSRDLVIAGELWRKTPFSMKEEEAGFEIRTFVGPIPVESIPKGWKVLS